MDGRGIGLREENASICRKFCFEEDVSISARIRYFDARERGPETVGCQGPIDQDGGLGPW